MWYVDNSSCESTNMAFDLYKEKWPVFSIMHIIRWCNAALIAKRLENITFFWPIPYPWPLPPEGVPRGHRPADMDIGHPQQFSKIQTINLCIKISNPV